MYGGEPSAYHVITEIQLQSWSASDSSMAGGYDHDVVEERAADMWVAD
jgi:hypothetical protein